MSLKTMMLTKHTQQSKEGTGGQTFRLIPISDECPYLIGEFDLASGKLVLQTKEQKDELQTVPKMEPDGSYIRVKNPQPNTPGVLMERRMIPEYFELHVTDTESIKEFIETVAINMDKTILYLPYLAKIEVNQPEKPKIITLS